MLAGESAAISPEERPSGAEVVPVNPSTEGSSIPLLRSGGDHEERILNTMLTRFGIPPLEHVARKVWLDPGAVRRLLGAQLPSDSRFVVAGALDDRLILLHDARPAAWLCGRLNGLPLGQRDFPDWFANGATLSQPQKAISWAEISEEAILRMERPITAFVALYHPENFPLPRFPLGISDLARSQRRTLMGQVELFDMQLGASLADVEQSLTELNPDIVGVSATFGQWDLLVDLLAFITEADWSPLVVVGGSLAPLTGSLIQSEFPSVLIADGAGEPTASDLASYWHDDMKLHQVRGLRRSDENLLLIGKKVSNRLTPQPLPELDLLPKILEADGVFQLESTRGCTHACSFCNRDHKGAWFGVDPSDVVCILDWVAMVFDEHPATARKVFLVDEEFLGPDRDGVATTRAEAVASALHKKGFRWETSARN